MDSQHLVHVLLVSFPAQGHINPLLRLGKILASKGGLLITFCTIDSIGKQMIEASGISIDEPTPVGDGFIRFEFFTGVSATDLDALLSELADAGKIGLREILIRQEKEGRPVSCVINNPFIPWASDVAESLNIPSAVLWVQSCVCFSAYYHYHNKSVPFPTQTEPELQVQLPNVAPLKHDEIPSFLHPSTPYAVLARAILGQFSNLSKPFCVLMETFQELDEELIGSMSKLVRIRPVGPLYKNPHAHTNSSSTTISGDFIKADNCMDWLDSKEDSSVVYIAFGSVAIVTQEQVNEIAHGLLQSGLSFLWVMKKDPNVNLPQGFMEGVGSDKGMVVQWSPQDKVLGHPAVACFLTHCGWNSTMEALASGVPVVAFPHWGDQVTNAKYLVDVFKVGLRLSRGEADNKVIGREEVDKCLREATTGVKAAELKVNALKWKKAAEDAVAEGGSSDRNIQEFVDDIKRISSQLVAS